MCRASCFTERVVDTWDMVMEADAIMVFNRLLDGCGAMQGMLGYGSHVGRV